MCGYGDFPSAPPDADKIFDSTRNGSIRNIHGTLIKEEKLALNGHPGRYFRSTGVGNAFLDEAMYLVGRRFYLISITTATRIPNKDIRKVLNSFHPIV